MNAPHTIIIGAGLAGLAAALKLSDAGQRVTLLEQRSFCGGRAYAFTDPKSGQVVDNGQHALMGCYQATLRYLERVGTRDLLREYSTLRVDLQDAEQRVSSLNCPPIPTPLHVLAGVLRMRGFPKRDVLRLVQHMDTIQGMTPALYAERDQWSVADWLDHCGQSDVARRILWEPLTLAVMNETMERASAAPLLMMMREGLLTRGVAQGMMLPTTDLSSLFVTPAIARLERAGVDIRMATGVQSIDAEQGKVTGVTLRNGESLSADAVIAGVTPQALLKLVDASPSLTHEHWASLPEWQSVPILSVHLWFDCPVVERAMTGLYDTPFHWVFDKGEGCVALVSSACREFAQRSRQDTIDDAIAMMHRYFPQAREAQVKHAQLTKELHATISIDQGSAPRRLACHTPWPNLLLAGDWTQTYLPATIEGAVRSGEVAVRAVIDSL